LRVGVLRLLFVVGLIVIAIALLNDAVWWAVTGNGPAVHNLTDNMTSAVTGWQSRVTTAATSLFWILAGIEIIIAIIWLAIQTPTLDQIFEMLVKRIMFAGARNDSEDFVRRYHFSRWY
jgi:type IV secretion system protein TrbL